MANVYYLETALRCSAEWRVDGVLTSPTVTTFSFKEPGQDVVEYTHGVDEEIVEDEEGKFHVDLLPSTFGIWWCRFKGTGAAAASAEWRFRVRRTRLAA